MAQHKSPTPRWLRRWLAHPVVCVVLLLLTGAAAYFAKGKWPQDPTAVGFLVHRMPANLIGSPGPLSIDAISLLGENNLPETHLDGETESFGGWIAEAVTSGRPMLSMSYITHTDSMGIWQYWTHTTHHRIAMPSGTTAWTGLQLETARRQFAAQLAAQGWIAPSVAEHLQSGAVSETVFDWLGPVHDIPAAVVLALTPWSVWLTWKHTLLPRLWRRRHRLAHGLCPSCGYDMQGLTTTTCPECGNTIKL